MSPTLFIEKGFRFLFFSREESRIHVHAQSPAGELKFWLEPGGELARNSGLPRRTVRAVQHTVEEHRDEIIRAWHCQFGR